MAGMAMVAHGATAPDPQPKIASVVRADPRTGRLVRKVVTLRPAKPAATPPQPAAKAAPATLPPLPEGMAVPKLVAELSQAYKVDPLLVHSVIQVESNYNPFAVSPKGAEGIMQLIPSTARRFGVGNTFNARENIEGGVKYLKYLESLFTDTRHVLAAYNAGEQAVIKYGGVPPYPETRNYVEQVGKKLGKLKAAELASSSAPSQEGPVKEPVPRIEQFTDAGGAVHYVTR